MNNTNYKETENFPLVATPLIVKRDCPNCGHSCDPKETVCPSCGEGNIDLKAYAEIDTASENPYGTQMKRAAEDFNKTLKGFYSVRVVGGFCYGWQFLVENNDDDGSGAAAEEIANINKWLEETARRLGLIVIR